MVPWGVQWKFLPKVSTDSRVTTNVYLFFFSKSLQRNQIFIRIWSSCVRRFQFTCISVEFCHLWPPCQLCCLCLCRYVSGPGCQEWAQTVHVCVCVEQQEKGPRSQDLRVTQRWQIVSHSLPLITALDPNWEFHLQTTRFDGQMFAQLPTGVRAEYFLSKCLRCCFFCFISLRSNLCHFWSCLLSSRGVDKKKTTRVENYFLSWSVLSS